MEKDACEKYAPNLGKYIKDLRGNEIKEFFEKYYIKYLLNRYNKYKKNINLSRW